jgi:hypothetical protein
MKKTRIVKLSDGVDFLKGKYRLLPSGKVLRLPGKESAKRMRRKLKKFRVLVDAGRMSYRDVYTAYQSWHSNYKKRFNAGYRILRMDGLYNDLFIKRRDDAAVEAKNENGLYCKKRKRRGLPHEP